MNLTVLENPPTFILGLVMYWIFGVTALGLAKLTRTSPDASENRLQNIDGLRGLLATGVFLHHFVLTYYASITGKWGAVPSRFYALLGSTSVALFFMITGFLFWQKLIAKDGQVNWKSLYISRVFRLVPLYWFAVAIVVAIVFLVGGVGLQVPLRNFVKQVAYWVSFIDYPNINRFQFTSAIVASVIWTLKYEWLFYLSLPLLAIFVFTNKKFPFMLWVLVGIVLWFVVRPYYWDYLKVSTSYLVYFMVGAIAASLAKTGKYNEYARHPVVSVICIISVALAFALFGSEYELNQVFFLALFFIPIALGNSLFNILTYRPFVLLGDISYSIYLLHGILLYVLYTIFFSNVMNPTTDVFQFYGMMAATGILLIVITWSTYNLIEKPFISLGRKISALASSRPKQGAAQ